MTLKEHAKQQEVQVRKVLDQLSSAAIELDVPHFDGICTAFHINYNEQDMLNAAIILNHICSNYAIKHGFLTPENTTEKINRFRLMLKDTFGLDTLEEIQKMRIMNDFKSFGGLA